MATPLSVPTMPKESTKTSKKRAAAAASEKKTKKGKDGPKRPLSAYMFFSQDWRERIKNENPDAGFGEIGKLLGTKWKELSDEEKKPYIEQAARDKQRAEREKAELEDKKEASGKDDDDDD